jgi:hypothetical protein
MKIKIYVAGPYSKGDQAQNVHEALKVGDYISSQGFHVKIPHLTHFWHMMFSHPYEFWINYDLVELAECNALVRISGESSGADGEVSHAEKLNLPIFIFKGFDLESLNHLDSFLHELTKMKNA